MTSCADLFEDIKTILMCDYLSDLKTVHYGTAEKVLLRRIDLQQYPLGQLSDLAQYLYGLDQPFCNMEEASAFFKSL